MLLIRCVDGWSVRRFGGLVSLPKPACHAGIPGIARDKLPSFGLEQ